jgi:O-antigen/teichoic acid export membrane protein
VAWFFVARVVATLVALLTLVVLTRLLNADDFGRYNITLFSAMIAQKLLFAWIVVSITRFNGSPEFRGRAVALGLGAAAGTVALLIPILAVAFLLVPPRAHEAYLLASALALALAIHEIALACLRVQWRGPAFSVVAIGRPIAGPALAAAILLAGAGYRGAVIAAAAAAFFFGWIGLVAAARRSGVDRPDGLTLRTYLTFGQPLALVMAGSMGFALSSQLVLASLADLRQVGFFAAAAVLSERSIAMMMMTLAQTSSARIFEVKEKRARQELTETLDAHFAFLLLFSVPIVMTFAIANDTISILLFGPETGPEIAYYLPFLACAALLNGMQSAFFSFGFTMQKRTLLQLGLTLSFLLLHILVSLIAVRAFGGLGAALTTVASAGAMVAVFAWYGRDVFRHCALRPALVRMSLAAAAALPFLAAADRAANLTVGVALVGGGMLAMLIVLKLSRYRSVELILETVLRARRG